MQWDAEPRGYLAADARGEEDHRDLRQEKEKLVLRHYMSLFLLG
jgi:hypothetical protein